MSEQQQNSNQLSRTHEQKVSPTFFGPDLSSKIDPIQRYFL